MVRVAVVKLAGGGGHYPGQGALCDPVSSGPGLGLIVLVKVRLRAIVFAFVFYRIRFRCVNTAVGALHHPVRRYLAVFFGALCLPESFQDHDNHGQCDKD